MDQTGWVEVNDDEVNNALGNFVLKGVRVAGSVATIADAWQHLTECTAGPGNCEADLHAVPEMLLECSRQGRDYMIALAELNCAMGHPRGCQMQGFKRPCMRDAK